MELAELSDLLDRILAQWENEVVEFKAAREQFSADKTGAYVSALSNEANLRGLASAWLVFGVSDNQEVVGTTHLASLEQRQALKHQVFEGTDPSLTIREIHELDRDGRRVVLAEIPAAPRGIPISWKGDYRSTSWIRSGPRPLPPTGPRWLCPRRRWPTSTRQPSPEPVRGSRSGTLHASLPPTSTRGTTRPSWRRPACCAMAR